MGGFSYQLEISIFFKLVLYYRMIRGMNIKNDYYNFSDLLSDTSDDHLCYLDMELYRGL